MPAIDWLNPKEEARKPKPAPRPEKKRVNLRIFGAQSLDQGLGLTKKQPDKSRLVFIQTNQDGTYKLLCGDLSWSAVRMTLELHSSCNR